MPVDLPVTGTVTRAELAERVADLGFTRPESAALVGHVLDALTGAIAAGESVTLAGFGRFDVLSRAPRTGRDLASGAPVAVPPRADVTFRAAPSLRDAVDLGHPDV